MINIISSSRYKINRKKITKELIEFLNKRGISEDSNLNVIFVGRIKMKQIATRYKKEPVALPVLSFSYGQPEKEDVPIGEVFICYPQAILLAAEREKRVDDIISFLVQHGIENILNN